MQRAGAVGILADQRTSWTGGRRRYNRVVAGRRLSEAIIIKNLVLDVVQVILSAVDPLEMPRAISAKKNRGSGHSR